MASRLQVFIPTNITITNADVINIL